MARAGSLFAGGRVEMDNNLVENAIRPTAIGKKNWLCIGDPAPKHPKDNPAARAIFKKTAGQGGRRGGWTPAPAVAPAL